MLNFLVTMKVLLNALRHHKKLLLLILTQKSSAKIFNLSKHPSRLNYNK